MLLKTVLGQKAILVHKYDYNWNIYWRFNLKTKIYVEMVLQQQ